MNAATHDARESTIVFDIGGTWSRSALIDGNDRVYAASRERSPSFVAHPSRSVSELQALLVEYLVAESMRLGQIGPTSPSAGVSLGAAVDARTGLITAASPLWGAVTDLDFDLESQLNDRTPGLRWSVCNDVTAAATGASQIQPYSAARRIALVTISSGIAMRTIEPSTGYVPISTRTGLQGEIGHLPAACDVGGLVDAPCDCGGANHLSAFSSGRGIERLLAKAAEDSRSWLPQGPSLRARLDLALKKESPEALAFMAAVTDPVARNLLAAVAVDGDIEFVVLTGGVVDGLGEHFMRPLRDALADHGLYGSSLVTADDFRELVHRLPQEFNANMRGAAHFARLLRAADA